VSISRAECTLRRKGDPDFVFKFSGEDDEQERLVSLRIDDTKSHSDIVITCTRDGFNANTVTSSFGPVTSTMFGNTSTTMEYPPAIIIPLHRK